MPQIIFNDVQVEYSSKNGRKIAALDGLCAEFLDGAFNVIVGYSGCGKTTLLKTIGGIQDYSGEILFDGCDAKNMSAAERNAAYVSQTYTLYPHMTIFENIAFPLSVGGAKRDEIIGRVGEVAEELGISACLSRKPKHLSGGQQQRVAIARALVKRPSVVLLDEPLSNIDAPARAQARAFLKSTLTRYGSTVVYVTHDFTEAMALSDKLFVMTDGKIEICGSANEVFSSGNAVVASLLNENGTF